MHWGGSEELELYSSGLALEERLRGTPKHPGMLGICNLIWVFFLNFNIIGNALSFHGEKKVLTNQHCQTCNTRCSLNGEKTLTCCNWFHH